MKVLSKTLRAAILFAASFLICVSVLAVSTAEDWDLPSLTSQYTDVLSILKGRDESAAKLDYTGDTNLPDGVIRFNRTSEILEIYDSGTSTWSDAQPDITTHLVDTANPHSVTAAQVGAPTTATFTAHSSSTANPHSVTAAQVGALATANDLSDILDPTDARTNIGAASAATLTAHTSNTSNPHSVTAGQVGALLASNNLSDIPSDPSARTNIGAASAGTNSDITALSAITDVASPTNIRIKSTSPSSYIELEPGGGSTKEWKLLNTGLWLPPNFLQRDWSAFSTSILRSIDPDASPTNEQIARALNSLIGDLIDMGILQ